MSPRVARLVRSTLSVLALPLVGATLPSVAQAAEPASAMSLPAKDFCALDSGPVDARRFKKKRLVLFVPQNLARVEAGEDVRNEKGEKVGTRTVLKEIGGAKTFGQVWTDQFPLRRFHNVLPSFPAAEGVESKDTATAADFLGSASGQEAQFVRYSLGCADYVAVPRVTDQDASWSTMKIKKIVNGQQVEVTGHALSLAPKVQVTVFKKEGDGFTKVTNLAAEGGGMFDVITDIGASTMALAKPGNGAAAKLASKQVSRLAGRAKTLEKTLETLKKQAGNLPVGSEEAKALLAQIEQVEAQYKQLHALLEDPAKAADQLARASADTRAQLGSGIPTANCFDGKSLSCTDGTFWLPERSVGLAGNSERQSEACKTVDIEDMKSVAACEVRVRTENVSLLARKQAQRYPDWRLYSDLVPAYAAGGKPAPGIMLGAEEGLRRGATLVAVDKADPTKVRGFAKVTSAGAGGQLAESDPSVVKFRAGKPGPDVRMQEYALIGVSGTATVGQQFGLQVNSDAPDANTGINENGWAANLKSLSGAGVDVGYDLTPSAAIGSELWLRTNLHAGIGSSDYEGLLGGSEGAITDVNWMTITALAGPEVKFHTLPRVDLWGNALGGMLLVSASTPQNQVIRKAAEGQDQSEIEPSDDSGAGMTPMLAVGAGVDVLLAPEWQLRVGGRMRQSTSDVKLEGSKDLYDGQTLFIGQNVGRFSSIEANASLQYVF